MIRTLRAAALAVAAFGLAGGVSFADPLAASESSAQADLSHYGDHATATIIGSELATNDVAVAAAAPAAPIAETEAPLPAAVQELAAAPPPAPVASLENVQHAVASFTSTLLNFANVVLPGSQDLDELVALHASTFIPDSEQECLAGAVYFEARGEPLEGQLAVAEVVLNRMASGKYPTSICAVVKQPWQFSFVRNGRFPPIDKSSEAWRKAVAIAHIAREDLAGKVDSNVLWYHATYVAPSWGRRLTRVGRIGTHIFYS